MPDRRLLGSLATTPDLDRWVTVEHDGTVVVRTGKVELGQGIRTALTAIAADELGVHPACIRVERAATGRSPNEGVTAGSGSIEQSGTAVRQACAHVRRLLLARAADALDVAVDRLRVTDGVVCSDDGRSVTYAELAAGRTFDVRVEDPVEAAAVESRRWVGRGLPRVDLPEKVRGAATFVHDVALAGMRHARVVRPPHHGARLAAVDDVPAGVDLVVRGSFVAVVADREATALRAAHDLGVTSEWTDGEPLPPGFDSAAFLQANVKHSTAIVDGSAVTDPPGRELDHQRVTGGDAIVVRAQYFKPFVMHGSIGPSAAVALLADGRLTVWSHSQGVELLRLSMAEALGLPADDVDVRHMDGAGCYGHNGADDAAMDAAVVAIACAATPIRLAWSRADEHGWEPLSPAMCVSLSAGTTGGRIASWQADVYSYPHGARPRPTGSSGVSGLLASWLFDPPATLPESGPSRGFHSGAHRNADPLYEIASKRIVAHLADSPVRTSSTRGLGAFANVFAIESFVDELAHASGADPVAFRLAHLTDPRAREVIEAVVELAGGLDAPGGVDAPGRGIAFARYENHKTYVAVITEVDVVARTGEVRVPRAWIAADAGEIIDPDGLVNQLEGGLVQAASWTLREQVGFDAFGVATRDWDSYPILRFSDAPEVTTRLIDRPGRRSLGAGEASTGPTPAAIANAVFQATGARIRDLPLRPERVKAVLAALL